MVASKLSTITQLRRVLSAARTREEVWLATRSILERYFACDACAFHPAASWRAFAKPAFQSSAVLPLQVAPDGVSIEGQSVSLPLFISDPSRTRLEASLLRIMSTSQLLSLALVPVFADGEIQGVIELSYRKKYHRWRREHCALLEEAVEHIGIHLARVVQSHSADSASLEGGLKSSVRDSIENETDFLPFPRSGSVIVVRTDASFVPVDVQGATEQTIGLSAAQVLHDPGSWMRFLHRADARRLLTRIRRQEPEEFSEELRVVNQRTRAVRWLLIHVHPRFTTSHEFIGWEGLGVDITEKHVARAEVVSQNRRLEALYTVSRSLQANTDPVVVALKGLRALLNATRSDGGLAFLYDKATEKLEVVAAHGVSEEYINGVRSAQSSSLLVMRTLEDKRGVLLDDIQEEPRAAVALAKREGLRATIMMPLVFENVALGALVLFCRRPARYSSADFDLVSAACSQIALAARQAEVYANEKTQASSLAALYRLSHELSQQVNLQDVLDHAFPIIQDELACKRMWLGVMNEGRSVIEGQAGFGPGMRKAAAEIKIALSITHSSLDRALNERHSVVVHPTEVARCSDLAPLFEKLQCGTVIVVPLIALTQVLGILVVEPTPQASFVSNKKLMLLDNMANDLAAVILARRFQARAAESDKMRVASHLASGIAHNFNNLLQAVVGQAQYIQLKCGNDPQVQDCAKGIIDAVTKGAGLVKQLYASSSPESFTPKPLSLHSLLMESKESFERVVGRKVALEYRIPDDKFEILGGVTFIKEVFSNLLSNARDAIGVKADGKIRICASRVKVRPGEIDPELSPGVYVRVDLEDNGRGMDEESQKRCFEPFYTTKNVDPHTGIGVEGSGLGLLTVYERMKHHDGLVTVKSDIGVGTMFSLYFPALIVKAEESADETSEVLEKIVEDSKSLDKKLTLRVEDPSQNTDISDISGDTSLLAKEVV